MDISYYKQYEPIFGVWHITRLIGEGSFGKVFEIQREDFGEVYKAALKVITVPASQSEVRSVMSEGMDEESIRATFQSKVQELVKEFALMSKLKGNSNVVSYENHQVIEHRDNIGWDILIQMELLTPLDEYIRQKKTIPRQEIIKLGIDLCRALELCQKHNIIHRDIKPENTFISEDGNFKLGDFGVARTVEKTTGGLSKQGSYPYMAPEVYSGKPYGTTVDIYSLGLILYRLLNGNRLPFLPAAPAPITYADRENALAKRFNGAPLPMPSHADGRLGEIVLKACAFDSKDRYSSPVQMRQELEAILYNKEEGKYIYPDGDEVPQNSIHSVNTEDQPPVREEEGTASDFSGTAGGFGKTVSDFSGTASGFGKTVSDFGGTASDFGGRVNDVSGGTDAQKKAGEPPAPKKPGRKLWIAAGAAGLLVIVLAVALFSKGDSGTESLPSADPAQTNRDEQDDAMQESVSETMDDSGAESLPSADPTQTIRDEQGNIVQEPIPGSTYYAVYEYDENGNMIKQSYYNADDGTLDYYLLSEYDENGNRIKDSDYDADGTLVSYSLYEYDENGNLIKESYYKADGTPAIFSEYDENGNEIKESYYDDFGTLEYYFLFEYDENGNEIKESCYEADGTLKYYYLEEYDENGNRIKESHYNSAGTLIRSWEYDENGNEIKKSFYDDDGTLNRYFLYEYDEAGNCVGETEYNPDGTPR